METVFRVLGRSDWDETLKSGVVPPCGSDQRDGFIHLSNFTDITDTANLYFEPDEHPLVLEVSVAELGEALVWEAVASRNNKTFPHLYAPGIPLDAIHATHELHVRDGSFHLGERHVR